MAESLKDLNCKFQCNERHNIEWLFALDVVNASQLFKYIVHTFQTQQAADLYHATRKGSISPSVADAPFDGSVWFGWTETVSLSSLCDGGS